MSARRVDDPVLGPGAVDCTTLGDAAPMCFIGVPSGSFMMGSEEEERALFHVFIPGFESRLNDEILHRVKLGAFELAATEVTDAQFKVVMGESLCHLSMYGCTAEEPTTIVFWDSAMEYLNKLTERENQRLGLMRTTCYEKRGEEWTWDKACTGYRLPTEAEWEYAARAGSHMHFSFGDYSRVLFDHAWLKYNSDDRAHPVGLKKPNAWGFFDMHGNVLEWVWDPYAPYDLMRTTNPTGPDSGKKRGCRGGTYISDPVELRSAARRWCDVGSSQSIMGFRVARGPLREPAP